MVAPLVKIRYSPRYIAIATLLGMVSTGIALFIWVETEAPPFSYIMLALMVLVTFIAGLLMARGGDTADQCHAMASQLQDAVAEVPAVR
ncbi:hypothetical protein [Glycomyces arizonensis]|uniref:hypothetical protein n=1 Tax=Glycomyces arizonensis TaxID=256035 RepID=UPI00047C7994|nr:hypothetical protein [Glycomyces arizonensis]